MLQIEVNREQIERLLALSKAGAYNPYERFSWPDDVPLDRLWCDEDLLTTYGTELHDQLTPQQKITLSKWEAINFFSLNVHGIKGVLEFVSQVIHEEMYDDIVSDYMHIFISEENAHMWFFAHFCKCYAGKIYSSTGFPGGKIEDRLERDLYMFASTLIFEEFVDFYNHKVGSNEAVPAIVRAINRQHHIDESRHVSFGREMVRQLFHLIVADDESGEKRARISGTLKDMIRYFVGLMYRPEVYTDAGIVAERFSSSSALRNWLRNSPDRKKYHGIWFRRTADFFQRADMIDDAGFLTQ